MKEDRYSVRIKKTAAPFLKQSGCLAINFWKNEILQLFQIKVFFDDNHTHDIENNTLDN